MAVFPDGSRRSMWRLAIDRVTISLLTSAQTLIQGMAACVLFRQRSALLDPWSRLFRVFTTRVLLSWFPAWLDLRTRAAMSRARCEARSGVHLCFWVTASAACL